MNWDHLRFLLHISRGGSLSAAAREMGVNQSTVSRRLAVLESRIGAGLFFKTKEGLTPTLLGEKLIHHAERMESEVLKVTQQSISSSMLPQGKVRIATMPWIFTYILLPKLNEFCLQFPDITILAVSGIRDRPLARREAELALRFEIQATKQELSIPIADCPYSLYAPRDHDHSKLPWVGFHEDFLHAAPKTWLENQMLDKDRITFQANDAGIIYEAARNGLGKGLIPDALAENDPLLQRVSGQEPEIVRRLHLLVHKNMRDVARVDEVVHWLQSNVSMRASENR